MLVSMGEVVGDSILTGAGLTYGSIMTRGDRLSSYLNLSDGDVAVEGGAVVVEAKVTTLSNFGGSMSNHQVVYTSISKFLDNGWCRGEKLLFRYRKLVVLTASHRNTAAGRRYKYSVPVSLITPLGLPYF